MNIEVLGMGCSKCKKVMKNTKKAVEEMGIDAEIIKVTDLDEITSYGTKTETGIIVTPALVVNGEVKSTGKVLKVEEIKELLLSD